MYTWNGAAVKHDTTLSLDTTRYHIWGYSCASANALVAHYDGAVIFTGGETAANSNSWDVYVYHKKGASGDVNHSTDTVWHKGFSTVAFYQTADGILESDATAAEFYVANGRWSQVDWTADTSDSTTITVQARCADTSAGLAGAVYETIATSGDPIVTQGDYIQVKITLADASSGQYTPILKTLTLTNETVAVKDPQQCIGSPF